MNNVVLRGPVTRLLETYFPSDDEYDSDYNPQEDEDEFKQALRETEEWDLIHRFQNLDVGPADHFNDQSPQIPSTVHNNFPSSTPVTSHPYLVSVFCILMFIILCFILYLKSSSLASGSDLWFCDTGQSDEFTKLSCFQCPFRATCKNGVATCKAGFFLTKGGECVEDTKLEKLVQKLKLDVFEILAQRKGLHSCGHVESQRIEESKLKEFLKIKPRNQMKLFDEAYGNWKIRVLVKVYGGVLYKRPFFEIGDNAEGTKPWGCLLKEVVWRNYEKLFASIATFIVIALSVFKYAEQAKLTKEAEDLHYRVYRLLVFNAEKRQNIPVPLQCIQTQFSPTSEVWTKVLILVNSDPSIQKSSRMIDGLQRSCWKLTYKRLSIGAIT